ncbi:hypothetical protein [Sphingobium yanoikuyae]|uniref:hypothetical protein n=1 Tax=Sphingobium yanoikuyae TaxID=13690 RepID=UPI0012377A79|nr:hypothetical protein [Sphingobium yanoikuyae]
MFLSYSLAQAGDSDRRAVAAGAQDGAGVCLRHLIVADQYLVVDVAAGDANRFGIRTARLGRAGQRGEDIDIAACDLVRIEDRWAEGLVPEGLSIIMDMRVDKAGE